nr:hypothetical protein [Sulfuracidifex tepidarius]
MEYSELVKNLEELIGLPIYVVVGRLKDNPILLTTTEGRNTVSTLIEGKLNPLTGEPIASVAPPKQHLDFIAFTRDAEKGKEIHSVYITNLRGEE